MKTIFALSVSLALITGAGSASAADELVNITANAPVICALPNTWSVNSTTSGASAAQFSGTTWTIPSSQFATASATAVSGAEIAIRLRGQGICNTSHTIQVASARGGLTAGDAEAAPPAGFTNRRAIRYEAYWVASGQSSSTVALGPKAVLNASAPGSGPAVPYVVSSALAPPGNRSFDIRIGMPRGAISAPMLAGDYSDTVTVTLAPQ